MNRTKLITFVTLGIMIGLVIGLILTSNFNWMMQSTAAENSTKNEAVVTNTGSQNQVTLADLEQTSRTFVEVVKRVSPTVVTITSKRTVKMQNPMSQFFGDEFFRRFWGQSPDNDEGYQQRGLGSGVIIDADGYVLTNNHVVEGADEVDVVINGEEFSGKIVGTDPQTDVAVVKINKTDLPFIRLGDSDVLQVGEIVLAIGSPFSRELENTVTQGIVSAKGRKGLQIGGTAGGSGAPNYQDFIQTDAAINPGNSGGALVNLRGELIGINTAIVGQSNVGIGFAIPINLARWVMDQIIKSGHVTRGYLGVVIGSIDRKTAKAFNLKETRGALVQSVQAGTPADKAGIREGDVILEFDGKPINNQYELTNLVAKYTPGSVVKVKIIRKGAEQMVNIKLTERPDESTVAQTETDNRENRLGIEVQNLTAELKEQLNYTEDYGVVVREVKPNSAAAEQGLSRGDIIMEFGLDRQKIMNTREFYQIVNAAKPGEVLLFRVKDRRGARFLTFEIPEK
ncbi:DegQ family serine endoprotease [candidate division KSB1 bacterium]|nr:DegQ family serine endoprotease [candidate division KSB1 bacterium]